MIYKKYCKIIAEQEEDWSLEPEVLFLVSEIVRQTRPHTIVEIGSYHGKSAISLAYLAATYGGTVYAVEKNQTFSNQILSEAIKHNLPLTIINKTSIEAFNDWGRETVDLLIIDADHNFSSEYIDIAMWSSLLGPSGWMVIHDTLTRLDRRFPVDYFSAPFLFDIVDIVGLRERQSSHSWEGVAFVRWCQTVRPLIETKFIKG
jgi:predicted O-methyltransferase YrrM